MPDKIKFTSKQAFKIFVVRFSNTKSDAQQT